MRSAALALVALAGARVLAGCGYELPAPRVVADGGRGDVARPPDVRVDAPPTIDTGVDTGAPVVVDRVQPPVDQGGPTDSGPVPVDLGFDLGRDLGSPDAGPRDSGVAEDHGAVTDRGPLPDGSCSPGERRPCYTGPASSQDQGLCRDGVQTCAATGLWGACDGEITPDCRGRQCGEDDCGGSCGMCTGTQVCDDAGRCVTPACGTAHFTLTCPGTTGTYQCPTNSECATGQQCRCAAGFAALTCSNDPCMGGCSFPDWYCARALFCAQGSTLCMGGYYCPRHARCDEATRGCTCLPGFTAVNCMGARCTDCQGTNYRCARL